MIKKLMPFVTSFSEAISRQYNHGDEVCVGGKVTSVIDFSHFADQTLETPEKHPGVYLTLDDSVGVNHIVVPVQEYESFLKVHGDMKGQIILAAGRVMKLYIGDKNTSYLGHPEQTTRVAAYYLGLVPEVQQEDTPA